MPSKAPARIQATGKLFLVFSQWWSRATWYELGICSSEALGGQICWTWPCSPTPLLTPGAKDRGARVAFALWGLRWPRVQGCWARDRSKWGYRKDWVLLESLPPAVFQRPAGALWQGASGPIYSHPELKTGFSSEKQKPPASGM